MHLKNSIPAIQASGLVKSFGKTRAEELHDAFGLLTMYRYRNKQ